MKKIIICILFIFCLINFLYLNCFAKKNNNIKHSAFRSEKKKKSTDKKEKNYVVEIPQVVNLDSRVALNRENINIIKREQKDRLLKNKVLLSKEVSTMNIKSKTWNENIKYLATEIKKKFLHSIIIIETYSNTQFSDSQNIKEAEKNGLIVANFLKNDCGLNNTICVIGLGAEKNTSFNYNCARISVIKDVGFYDSIQ
jgi:hypothetical protein